MFCCYSGPLAALGEARGIDFPTARWFFEASREVPLLKWGEGADPFLWFGWLSSAILVMGGALLVIRSFTGPPPNPVTVRRMRRFKEIKRGYYSLIILLALAGLAALDQVVVGKEALAVNYKGKWHFPAFDREFFTGSDFGIDGERAEAPVNYRNLQSALKESRQGKVIMPLIPFGSTDDTLKLRSKALVKRQGVYEESGSREPYFGLAAQYHNEEEGTFHLRYTLRNGQFDGAVDGWNADGERVLQRRIRGWGKGRR